MRAMLATESQTREKVIEWLGDFLDAETTPYLGKRDEPRFYPWSAALELKCDGRVVVARGTNVSSSGVGFVCKLEIPPRSIVEIRCIDDEEDLWIPIRIQHSTQSVGSFKVGAKFLFDD